MCYSLKRADGVLEHLAGSIHHRSSEDRQWLIVSFRGLKPKRKG
jgi:hypothetical protein